MFWPYVVIKGMDKCILVFNVNEKNIVTRIEMPNHLMKIPKTYVTESFDLFLLGETEHGYEMYRIDLD